MMSLTDARPTQCVYAGPNGNAMAAYAAFNRSINVTCSFGYRPSSTGPTNDTSRTHNHTLVCGSDCTFRSPTGAKCEPVVCPMPSTANALINDSSPFVHSDTPRILTCKPGYMLEGSSSSFSSPCNNSFEAMCQDGAVSYSAVGTSRHQATRRSHIIPRCIQITNCSVGGGDVCGREGCSARTVPGDANAYWNGSSLGSNALIGTTSGGTMRAMCAPGYRAVPSSDALNPACDGLGYYDFDCQFCSLMRAGGLPGARCKKITCDAAALSAADPHATVSFSAVAYQDVPFATCKTGYRVSSGGAIPQANASKTYSASCNSTCGFSTGGLSCELLQCSAPNFTVPRARPLLQELPMHEGSLVFTCEAGWRYSHADAYGGEGDCPADFPLICVDGSYTTHMGECKCSIRLAGRHHLLALWARDSLVRAGILPIRQTRM